MCVSVPFDSTSHLLCSRRALNSAWHACTSCSNGEQFGNGSDWDSFWFSRMPVSPHIITFSGRRIGWKLARPECSLQLDVFMMLRQNLIVASWHLTGISLLQSEAGDFCWRKPYLPVNFSCKCWRQCYLSALQPHCPILLRLHIQLYLIHSYIFSYPGNSRKFNPYEY